MKEENNVIFECPDQNLTAILKELFPDVSINPDPPKEQSGSNDVDDYNPEPLTGGAGFDPNFSSFILTVIYTAGYDGIKFTLKKIFDAIKNIDPKKTDFLLVKYPNINDCKISFILPAQMSSEKLDDLKESMDSLYNNLGNFISSNNGWILNSKFEYSYNDEEDKWEFKSMI